MARIFISSTYKDLAEHRKAVQRFLRQKRHEVSWMESYGASTIPPLDECLREVEKADLYLGILAWNYGYVPEQANRDRHSITELEYLRARELNKDCLWFLQDGRNWDVSKVDEGEARKRLERLRHGIENEQVVAHFPDEDGLIRAVEKALTEWTPRFCLRQELSARYNRGSSSRRTEFTIVPDGVDRDNEVYRRSAEIVANTIVRLQRSGRTGPSVNVGVSGGMAHRYIIENLVDLARQSEALRNTSLTFTALNRAAMAERYDFSANYLATWASRLIGQATHVTNLPGCTQNERVRYEVKAKSLDLIIAGSGGAEDGFLATGWLGQIDPDLALPGEAVGDFCLVPIDVHGKSLLASEGVLEPSVEGHLRALDTWPRFDDLKNVVAEVVMPLAAQPRRSSGEFTRKGLIGHVVLKSGIVSHCILTESTAETVLEATICGYRMLASEDRRPDAEGEVYSAIYQDDERPVAVRLVHQSALEPMIEPDDHPAEPMNEILVSDPPGEQYESAAARRTFSVVVGRTRTRLRVGPGVRKPGMWSATAVRVARRILRSGRVDGQASVLDMGCGCGVVGVLLGAEQSVVRVTFIDLDLTAVRCALDNAQRTPAAARFEGLCGDLFDPLEATRRRFDLIVFGPPFYPHHMVPETETPTADIVGPERATLTERFAKEVAGYLEPEGRCLTYITDFLDYGGLENTLRSAGLEVRREFRDILYPYEPGHGFPHSYEIQWRERIESENPSYRFREEVYGGRRYLAFKMVHFEAWRR